MERETAIANGLYYESPEEDEPFEENNACFGENTVAEIFGRERQVCIPLKATSSDIAVNDPLRSIKIEIKSVLVADGAQTAQQIANCYIMVYGFPLAYTKNGYGSAEELLDSMSDVFTRHIDTDGQKWYTAKTNEKHEDLQHLIRRQITPSSSASTKRVGRVPCSSGPSRVDPPPRRDIPPPSDQRKRHQLKESIASTKVIGQFPCTPKVDKLQFNDEGPKSAQRCRIIADMVRKIGMKSPDGTEVRCHVEQLKNYYWQESGLSIWGKIMPVEEYARAWDHHDFAEFWRIMKETTENGYSFFMVVPTDPKKNYLHLVPPEMRPAPQATKSKDNFKVEDLPFKKPVISTASPAAFPKKSQISAVQNVHAVVPRRVIFDPVQKDPQNVGSNFYQTSAIPSGPSMSKPAIHNQMVGAAGDGSQRTFQETRFHQPQAVSSAPRYCFSPF